MKTVRDIPELHGIPVLVRAALNVPLADGRVTNTYRLRRGLPTLQFLAERGARVIVISHIGEKGTETLAPVAEELARLLPRVSFCPHLLGEPARAAVHNLLPGEILVLENLRRHTGEVGNDREFATKLASFADVFVQDSFDTCHRMHASIVTLPTLLPSYAGLQLEEETRELTAALSPKHPALAIIGGAKFSTKEPVLEKLLQVYDQVFVGGALGNDFLKASGCAVGKSLVSLAPEDEVKKLLGNNRLMIPVDSRVVTLADRDAPDAHSRTRVVVGSVGENDVILDHGPATEEVVIKRIREAKTVLWNGPVGRYENGFSDSTRALARAVAVSGARSYLGGGDTVAIIEELGLLDRFTFVSTGGGAMLDFLAQGTLPGITALA